MKEDDLTRVRHIGAARMKILNNHGVTTIEQLLEMPLEELGQIKRLGGYYAKLIKDAVEELYKAEKNNTADGASPGTDRTLTQKLKKINARLKTAKEKFKPINKKKHLKLFLDVKKSSARLKTRIHALGRIQQDLSEKQKKKIIKKATALNTKLKSVGKNKKNKTMKVLLKEIQSFSNLIK